METITVAVFACIIISVVIAVNERRAQRQSDIIRNFMLNNMTQMIDQSIAQTDSAHKMSRMWMKAAHGAINADREMFEAQRSLDELTIRMRAEELATSQTAARLSGGNTGLNGAHNAERDFQHGFVPGSFGGDDSEVVDTAEAIETAAMRNSSIG